MKKRLMAALMAAVVFLGAVPTVALAVTPADPLIASALYSFLLSAGYKLFRQGGIEDADLAAETLTNDVKTLYGEFAQEAGTGYDWESMGQGVSVSEGNFILNHSSALSAQAFADWLAAKNEGANSQQVLITGGSGGSVAPGSYEMTEQELQGLRNYGVTWTTPIYTGVMPFETVADNPRDVYCYEVGEHTTNVYVFKMENVNGYKNLCFVSLEPFKIHRYQKAAPNSGSMLGSQQYTLINESTNVVTRPNSGNNFVFYARDYADQHEMSPALPINYVSSTSFPITAMGYVILAGDAVTEPTLGDLIGALGPTIANVVHDLAQDQGLSISVGAAQNADEETVVGVVAGDFALPDAETEIGAVATPVPIEGVTEPYPQPAVTDVESLGLPDLGAALTSRFPFCIPWDFVNVYKSLNATAQCPIIDVDLFPAAFKSKIGVLGNTSFTINFGDPKYSTFITLIHWGSLVGFVLALALATKRLIWTTGG